MPRNISFALTTAQFLDRSKSVTRRLGWTFLKPGDVLCGVEKSQGLKRGERVRRLGYIRVVSICRERLDEILTRYETRDECAREGFPGMKPGEFVLMFCRSHEGCGPASIVTRIQFEHIDPPEGAPL